jgi:hypothetical protein
MENRNEDGIIKSMKKACTYSVIVLLALSVFSPVKAQAFDIGSSLVNAGSAIAASGGKFVSAQAAIAKAVMGAIESAFDRAVCLFKDSCEEKSSATKTP